MQAQVDAEGGEFVRIDAPAAAKSSTTLGGEKKGGGSNSASETNGRVQAGDVDPLY